MRLFAWFLSLFSTSTRRKPATAAGGVPSDGGTADVDLPTRIVRVMRREGGIASAESLMVELRVTLDETCAAMRQLLADGSIREDSWQPGPNLHSRQVVYALAY